MFEEGFPVYLTKELHNVLGILSTRTYNNVRNGCLDMDWNEDYILLDGSKIAFLREVMMDM